MSDELKWDKVARLLMLNSAEDLIDLFDIIKLITNNLISNSYDGKYASVKVSNPSIQRRIVQRIGGVEFLQLLGFNAQLDEDGNKILKIQTVDHDPMELTEYLTASLEWLNNTVTTCVDLQASIESHSASKACCECVIQLKLPTGTVVSGGFMCCDTLDEVLNFARSYFTNERYNIPDTSYGF